MRIKLIACKVMTREISLLAARSPHYIDITWLRQGLHNEPERLRQTLQEVIDQIDAGTHLGSCQQEVGGYDAIVLGYGLCSNGIVGVGSNQYPVVVPRAHDCITLFLGSKERYRQLFDANDGGIYWYTDGWIENSIMPSRTLRDQLYEQYAELYGEENADYLIEMDHGWYANYQAAIYLSPFEGESGQGKAFTQDAAAFFHWKYMEQRQDPRLFEQMLSGDWDPEQFLVVPAGAVVAPSYEEETIVVSQLR